MCESDPISDWGFLALPEVTKVIERVVKQFYRSCPEGIDRDDLLQHAYVMAATDKSLRESWEAGELGLFGHALKADLLNFVALVANRMPDPLPEVDEDLEPPFVPIRMPASTYSIEDVEALLPAVWDESYCYGLPPRTRAEPGMPLGSRDVRRSSDLFAHIADIRRAWQLTPLSEGERRAVVRHFGLCHTMVEIGQDEGVSQGAISQRVDAAVSKIAKFLNKGAS